MKVTMNSAPTQSTMKSGDDTKTHSMHSRKTLDPLQKRLMRQVEEELTTGYAAHAVSNYRSLDNSLTFFERLIGKNTPGQTRLRETMERKAKDVFVEYITRNIARPGDSIDSLRLIFREMYPEDNVHLMLDNLVGAGPMYQARATVRNLVRSNPIVQGVRSALTSLSEFGRGLGGWLRPSY